MRMLTPYLSLLLFIISCGSSKPAETTNSIPQDLKTDVEYFIDSREEAFDHQFETYLGVEWGTTPTVEEELTKYQFYVVYERDGKKYPLPHQVIVTHDTIFDIQRPVLVGNGWESLLPKPFNVKEQKWWREITDADAVLSIAADHKKLILIDSVDNDWIEVFTGSTVIFNSSDTLYADTLFWDPKNDQISTTSCKLITAKGTITGANLTSDGEFTAYTIGAVFGMEHH